MHLSAFCNEISLEKFITKVDLALYGLKKNKQIFRVMKLAAFLLIVAFHVSATGISQITLSEKNAPLEKVFNAIEKQSGYVFFYDYAWLDEAKTVSIEVKNALLTEALNECFKDQPLTYSIIGKTIVVKQKEIVKQKTEAQALIPALPPPRIIAGTITDEEGTPLAGVSISVRGTTRGTTTDGKGSFKLEIPEDGAVLLISYIGYAGQVIVVGNRTSININLQPVSKEIDEVVVGYGSVRKSDLTGAVSSISEDMIEKVPASSFDLKLQGRVAGVNVTSTSAEPDGGVSVRIRGSNSISADNEPLYVVDGYPLPQGGEASGDGLGQPANALSGINPDDIKSIQILKDASATAIYGSRGSNGVVIITTKRGKEGKATIHYSARAGVTNVINLPGMMKANQYAQMMNDYYASLGEPLRYDGSSPKLPKPEDAGDGTNWVKAILRTGFTQSHQLSTNGGTKAVKYNISGNYYTTDGVVKNSNFKRGTLMVNLDNKISDRISVSTTLNLSNSNYNRIKSGSGAIQSNSDPISFALRANPIFPIDAAVDDPLFGGTAEATFFNNPVTVIKDKKDITQNESYFASISAVYQIVKGLTLNLRGGSNSKYSTRKIYSPRTIGAGFTTNGDARSNSLAYKDYIAESFLKFQKTINKIHKVDLTGGVSYQTNTSQTTNIRVTSFPNDILDFEALQSGLETYPVQTSKIVRNLQSAYIRGNYDLLGRYLFTFTGRADGSSVFAKNNKWGYFPSGAIAWKVSKEPFFPKNEIISDIKIRASYGLVGNQAIPPLGSLAGLNFFNYNINDQLVSGISPASVANPDLKWETTKQIDIGGDFTLIDGKLNLVVDVYKKTTNDLLQDLQIPISSGFSSSLSNLGSIENKGLEIELSGDIFSGKTFTWTPSFNISFNRSKILDLGEKQEIYGPAPGTNYLSSSSNIMQVGQPFAMFYGLKALRLIQPGDFDDAGNPTFATFNGLKDLGQWLYADLNNDGFINDADRTILGNPYPKYTFGFNNDFKYRNFQLSIFIQGVQGNDVMNFNSAFIASGYVLYNKTEDWYKNRWTPDNPTNNIRYTAFGTAQSSLVSGNYYLEDASYIRLKNVRLSYRFRNIGNSKIGKSIKSALVYISGTNLFTLTKYSGFDPEVGIYGQNNEIPGIDFGAYPRSREFYLGLSINL